MIYLLSSISSGLEFWSVNHISIYENSASKVFKHTKLLHELSNNWPHNFLGINVYKTLESCWQSLFLILKWANTSSVISKWGAFLPFFSFVILLLVQVDCGFHPFKLSLIFQKQLTTRIWDCLTFNIYYLGLFSQNFRSISLFLRKLEPFCRGWLEKFCLVAKIQHFLPYLKTQVKS